LQQKSNLRKIYNNNKKISRLRIGPKLITASALDSIAFLPEGKGKKISNVHIVKH